jgi:hypothetical protein
VVDRDVSLPGPLVDAGRALAASSKVSGGIGPFVSVSPPDTDGGLANLGDFGRLALLRHDWARAVIVLVLYPIVSFTRNPTAALPLCARLCYVRAVFSLERHIDE